MEIAVKPREITTNPRRSDKVFRAVVSIVGLFAFAVLLLIGTFLALRGFQIFKIEGFKFLTSSDWNVTTDDAGKQAGFRQNKNTSPDRADG